MSMRVLKEVRFFENVRRFLKNTRQTPEEVLIREPGETKFTVHQCMFLRKRRNMGVRLAEPDCLREGRGNQKVAS